MNNSALLSPARGSASEYKRIYDQASQLVKIGAWECDLKTEELIWTDGVYDLFELPRGSTLVRAPIVDMYFDDSRRQMQRMRADAIRRGGSFTLDAQIRTAGNKSRWMRLSAQAVLRHGRPVRIFGAKQDITHEKELWDHLKQLADQDSLTGLANRRVFEARCNDLIKRDINDGSIAALALIDLDHFKSINDRLGHSAGDECLRQFAARLHQAFKDAVVIARLGGDEFAVLLHAPLGRPQLRLVLEYSLRTLCRPVAWKNSQIDICASIGVTLLTRAVHQGPAQFFAEADSALYVAKGAGRNAVRIFNESVEEMQLSKTLDAIRQESELSIHADAVRISR
jgi:diguanylate cyclase (GGDEF)-like protein